MRNLLVAAALALAATPPVSATPVTAATTTCVANTVTGSCQFACVVPGIITVRVYGPGAVQGSAECGSNARAHCTGQRTCTGSDGSSTGGGWCDLTTGTMAICSSTGDVTNDAR